MKFELENYGMTSKQLELLAQIIQIEADKNREYENAPKNCCGVAPEPEPTQPTLPFDGEIETGIVKQVDKPKRTRQKKEEAAEIVPETASEATNAPQDDSEVTSIPSEPYSVSESDIKEMAQNLVRSVGRERVKEVINRFAEKLSEVKVSDYPALVEAFKSLEG